MGIQKLEAIYSGKAKTLFKTDNDDYLIMHYRDDITAFNAEKKATLANKGKVNNFFNAFIMEKLKANGISTHFQKILNDQASLVKRLDMIPLECVVRNYAAGGLCRRLGIEEGRELIPPIFEFFLKNDALADPMVNESHIHTFRYASDAEIHLLKTLTLKVNDVLEPLFAKTGLLLVDYKLEFGRFNSDIILGDEFTPDGCRIWDIKSHEIFDKDRFRNDLGDVIKNYEHVAKRLGVKL